MKEQTRFFETSGGLAGSIRLLSAMALLLIMQISAPNALAQIPPSCTLSLTNNVNDNITVTASISTPDLAEGPEGEALAVTSSGGDLSAASFNYDTCGDGGCTGGPKNFTYVASQANETISGNFQGGAPDGDESCALSATVSSQPPQPTGQGANNTFTFNATAGSEVQHVLQFPSDAVIPPGIDPGTLQVISTNNLVSDSSTWPQYVGGTPFAPSHCFVKPGDGGTDNCSLYQDVCFDANHAPSDANCPVSAPNSPNLINIEDVFDPTAIKPSIAQATTAVLIHFSPASPSETWSPVPAPNPVCTTTTGAVGGTPPQPPIQCDISNLLNLNIHGDCCTTISGGGTKKGEFISVFNVPMLETQVKVNGVNVNTPGVQGTSATTVPFQSPSNLTFQVMPAQGNGNAFVAAPVAKLTYGATGPTPVADTTTAFDTSAAVTRTTTNNSVTLQPGQYIVHWSAVDNVGIIEQNVHQVPTTTGVCPDGSADPGNNPCYVTDPFTATVNVFPPFTGFYQPVDNLPILNALKAGAAVPVKFSLGGNQGLGIFAAGYPTSGMIGCSSTATIDPIEQTVTAGGSSLQYDPTSNQYTYVWKTNSAWAGTCRQLVLKLIDGTSHYANFKFK